MSVCMPSANAIRIAWPICVVFNIGAGGGEQSNVLLHVRRCVSLMLADIERYRTGPLLQRVVLGTIGWYQEVAEEHVRRSRLQAA
jgi:hypothetical protein